MIRRYGALLALILTCVSQGSASPTPRHVSAASLEGNTRGAFEKWMEDNSKLWDDTTKLVHSPEYVPGRRYPGNYIDDHHYFEKCCSKVRETSSYALALLFRDAPGDRERAADALNAVLKEQYVIPGVKWFGTFKRTPEEPTPGTDAQMWQDYDPNWREFIGTNLEMIVIEYPDRISPEMLQRLYKSIDLAVEGEMADGRLVPSYTNPALMYGALWDFAATHDKRADWQTQSMTWMESVYNLFKKYNSFYEYNSPTYAGVDLYALALWCDYGSTQPMRAMGLEMEATLWNDIAAFYQPNLHNLSGPYDRSYGMDTETAGGHAAGGVIDLMHYAVDVNGKPLKLPENDPGAGFSCPMTILGTRIPSDALLHLQKFEGEHLVRRQISDERVATAWIGTNVIFGGEATSKTRDVGKNSQFHPVTVQWRTPSGEIGWIQVAQSPMIDAVADPQGLTISTTGTIRFRIHAKGMDTAKLGQALWTLPGLTVSVTSDAHGAFSLVKSDEAYNQYFKVTDDMIDLVYPNVTRVRLEINADGDRSQGFK